jgi:N-acetylmuramoyl-L-alanine amidase
VLLVSLASLAGVSDGAAQSGVGWGTQTEVRTAPGRKTQRKVPREAAAPLPQAVVASRITPPDAPSNAVIGYAIEGDRGRTLVTFDLANPTDVTARSVANPPRVIVDLPETDFHLPPQAGQVGHGLVSQFRYGLIEAGKSRIVIDTHEPARVERAELVLADAGGAFRLEIELHPTTSQQLAAAEIVEAVLSLKPTLTDIDPPPGPRPDPTASGRRPVIVVDAGHGGIDSGATGAQVAEKDLVLSVARHVAQALTATQAYDVVMTRTADVFVPLDERVAIAQRHNADLFVSIHADSIPGAEAARHVRGATVYTLSEHASDDLTRRVADKENAVDLLAGLPASTTEDESVRGILMDLMWRETMGFAGAFRDKLLAELGDTVLLSRDPRRSGPFRVLRNPGSPAVLVELGYISNPDDERIMLKSEWQAKVAESVARAVAGHFRQRRSAQR